MLEAGHKAGIKRVATLSSVNVIGVFSGEAAPDYLPIDHHRPILHPLLTDWRSAWSRSCADALCVMKR
jgi:hypothetical protein